MQLIKGTGVVSSIASRIMLFALVWWVLTDGSIQSWSIGVPAVLLAAGTSIRLIEPTRLVWYELLRFVPFFIIHSVRGGADVAWRAFQPRMPIDPGLVEFPILLPDGLPRVFMINTVNLLPGTLSAELYAHSLKIHTIDMNKDYLTELNAVQQNVARLFDIILEPTEIGI